MFQFRRPANYVSEEALNNLRFYKYAAEDKSYISQYILRHYWNYVVELFPMWMAPNLITLCGLGFVVINLICVLIYTPDLETPAPSWVYFSFAIGIWLYSTFDNVDGKQARRTGTSSPLGELFDHGCDALNCSIGGIVQAAGMGLGYSWYTVLITAMTTIPFYLSTWEEYHTGVLYLGVINGPTEGLIVSCLTMILTGIYGPQMWRTPIYDILGSLTPSFVPESAILLDAVFLLMYGLLFFAISPASFIAVYNTCQTKFEKYTTALIQLLPMSIYLISTYLWLASPYSSILENHLILFILTIGIVFGRMATKIILAHVTKSRFPMFTVLIAPIIGGALLTNIPYVIGMGPILSPTAELWYLIAFFIFSTVVYFHWALLVINSFCTYLGISCLTIPGRSYNRL